jgi:hypothetical protein
MSDQSTLLKTLMDTRNGQDLRRWAVEQAVKWPMIYCGSNNSAAWVSGAQTIDADVISRAQKLVAYVLDQEESQ